MLAWSEGLITDVRNSEIMVMTRHCRAEGLFTDYSDHPRKLVNAKTQTQINRRRTLPASFPLVGCLPQAAWPERLLRKVRTLWYCSSICWSVALYLWLIVVISVRQSTVAAISGLHCRALVMVSLSIRLTAWLQNLEEAGGTVREIDVWERVTAIISALVICIIVRLSWAVNHYRDNAITYKAQRVNARELKLANAAITDMQMRQRDVAALDAKNTRRSWLMPKMMLCVMMLPLVVVGCTSAVCQSVREANYRLRRG